MATFYREAALVLKRLKQKKGSLKSLVFSTGKRNSLSYRKKLYALTLQTLKCEDFIAIKIAKVFKFYFNTLSQT